jgi:hypothetical protein
MATIRYLTVQYLSVCCLDELERRLRAMPSRRSSAQPRWLDGIHLLDLALAKTKPFERLGNSELDVRTAGVDGIGIDETKPYLCRTDLRGLTRG